jgi:hypothetical protein
MSCRTIRNISLFAAVTFFALAIRELAMDYAEVFFADVGAVLSGTRVHFICPCCGRTERRLAVLPEGLRCGPCGGVT